MRRKSERTANKKTKASPEKKDKPDKLKRSKTRRRKQSASSDNESVDESKLSQPTVPETTVENNPPQTSTKEESPEETNEVWQVKAAEGDVGEIQKLKICLTRPPSTPERAERSPRSKRKHSRSASGEPIEDRKKSKHRSKRSGTETKEEADKSIDSQGDEPDNEKEQEDKSSDENKSAQTQEVTSNTAPTPSTTDDTKPSEESKNDSENTTTEKSTTQETNTESKSESTTQKTNTESKSESTTQETNTESKTESTTQETNTESKSESTTQETNTESKSESTTQESNNESKSESQSQDKQSDADTTVASPQSETENSQNSLSEKENSSRKRSLSCEKSEILEIHAEEIRCESSDVGIIESQTKETKPETPKSSIEENTESVVDKSEVSTITDDKTESINSENINSTADNQVTTNEQNVVESSKSPEKEEVSLIAKETDKPPEVTNESNKKQNTTTAPVSQVGTVHNGQITTHTNRKRRWGSRPNRITTQKSITISTDVLKDIIPDVKPVEFDEVIEEKKHKRVEVTEKLERPVLPKIVIDNTESVEVNKPEKDDRDKENVKIRESNLSTNRKISIVKDSDSIIARSPSPPRHKQSNILYITNLVRPFTLPQLKNLLQRTGRIVESGFWIDRIKSKCFVQYESEDQAVETRHALHGVTWPVSNPKTLHVDFSTKEDFDKAKTNEETDNAQASTIPGTVEDWLREQDLKRERGELEKPWERKTAMREWDVGKNEKGKEKEKLINRDDRLNEKRRHRTPERSPEPARKFKKKEEEAPAKLLDDLFRKTKATPCIYWLPLSAETIAVKEEQRRQHMAEHERRLQELRRTHRRH